MCESAHAGVIASADRLLLLSVLHLCASIRFWERRSFTYPSSASVNIDGTANIIRAVQELPDTSEKIMLHCSSAAVCLPEPLFMRLGWNWRKGYASSYTLTDEKEIPDDLLASHDYARTKAVGDKLVRQANGVKGIKTGVVCFSIRGNLLASTDRMLQLRPGMSVCSPNDLFAGMIMRQPHNPTFVGSYARKPQIQAFHCYADGFPELIIDSRDLATCFLLYEAALRERPQEVDGEALWVFFYTEAPPY